MRYPRPALDTRYSPMMEPIHAMPTFILRHDASVDMLDGNTSFVKICSFPAFIARMSSIFSGLVCMKPPSIVIIVTMTEISTAMNTMAFCPVPAHTIITGPSAILGRLFSTTT